MERSGRARGGGPLDVGHRLPARAARRPTAAAADRAAPGLQTGRGRAGTRGVRVRARRAALQPDRRGARRPRHDAARFRDGLLRADAHARRQRLHHARSEDQSGARHHRQDRAPSRHRQGGTSRQPHRHRRRPARGRRRQALRPRHDDLHRAKRRPSVRPAMRARADVARAGSRDGRSRRAWCAAGAPSAIDTRPPAHPPARMPSLRRGTASPVR